MALTKLACAGVAGGSLFYHWAQKSFKNALMLSVLEIPYLDFKDTGAYEIIELLYLGFSVVLDGKKS